MVLAAASLSFPFNLFAQTPQTGEDDYETYTAASRALAAYAYDPAGRVTEVTHRWQVWNTQQQLYDEEPVAGSSAAYSSYLALKSSTSFLEPNGSGGWQTDRTEYYTYDGQTDWLTGVDYNDGLSNEVTTWTYDASGNRTSDSANSGTWTYDALNRMTASPFGTYTNDLVGNRTELNTSGDDPRYT
jgi:YD repeat-containing protein